MSIDVAAFPKPPEWMSAAACVERGDPEWFFPTRGGSARKAKAVCATCPVTASCLAWALATNERAGVYGGLTERERRALHQRECRRPGCDRNAARGRRYCGDECCAAAHAEAKARFDAKRQRRGAA